MRIRSYIKLSGILALAVGALVIGFAVFLPRLLDINAYRDEILATLQQSLNRKVSFTSGSFAWHFGPSFDFSGVTVKERDGVTDFLKAERITVKLALWPLLEKQVVLQDLRADKAYIQLIKNGNGSLNIDDLLKPSKDSVPIHFRKIQFRRSSIQLLDMEIQKEGMLSVARNISLDIDRLARGRKGNVKLSCELASASGSPGIVNVSGSLKLPSEGRSLAESEYNGTVDVKQFDAGRFWPYYGRFIPFDNSGGKLDLTSSFKGHLKDFDAKGKIRLSGAAVVWPKIFHYTVAPRSLLLNYDLHFSPSLIDVPALEMTVDGFRIKGSFQMHDYAGKDPRILAKAHTPATFRYEDVRSYVPYGIIPPDTSDYIEHKIKSGIFKLDTGVLDGRISQIAHMEIGDNYKTLLIRGPVEKAVLSYGPKAPVFSNIKGTIELKDTHFSLIGMTALFGESPLKMNGYISEYNTDKPSDYPVHMEVTPHSPEIAWLARIVGANKLEFSGASALVLNGSGHYSSYRLNGEWELKQAAYSFPGAVRKPAGMPNRLTFSSIISAGETKLTSLAYNLAPLSLSAAAVLKYSDQPYLGFDLQTNTFTMSESLPILTEWQKYHLRGRAQARIAGTGNPEDFSAMKYTGAVTLNAFSLQPDEKLKAISGINGTVAFKGNSLETSNISARYGDSALNVKGQVRSLKSGDAEITLSSPKFFLRDFSQALQKSDVAIRRLNSTLLIQEGKYLIKNFSGLLNNSNFSINGMYSGGSAPEAAFTVTSSNLDVDDLLLLSKLGNSGNSAGQAARKTDLKLKLIADAGKYGRIPFNKLDVTANQDAGVLYLQSLEASVFGGKLAAKGRVASSGGQGSRYDLNFNFERANADRLLQALDITREVNGTLNVQGDITARGETFSDIKKTALGNVRLRLENGSLRRFNALSKMFSILNVSQLLKFQLPDMVSGGMPYNEIKGSFSINDGTVATQDLFIASDAINISVVGKSDIVKEELDFTIGVQPLQTVDKVVNRIPVVGWLLTGKDKDFLTVFFEAKGKWSDPQVSAIPAKSVAKGVFNVFRRVFELPVRLFTDTGEVILGK
jgi:uncharacterized protein YhdP